MTIQIELEELDAQKIASVLNERHLGQTVESRKRNLRLATKIVNQLSELRNKNDGLISRREEV